MVVHHLQPVVGHFLKKVCRASVSGRYANILFRKGRAAGAAAAASAGGGSTAVQPRFSGSTAPLPSSTGLNRVKSLCEVPDPNEHVGMAPRWCAAPQPVHLLSVLWSAFQLLWCLLPPRGLLPPALVGSCAGHGEAGRETGSLCLPLAPPEAGALGSPCVVPVAGPAMGLSLAGPSCFCLGLLLLRWVVVCGPGH